MKRIFLVFLVCFFAARGALANGVVAARAAAATASPEATAAAIETLRRGGNAVDAAIVAALVLAVVEPQSSGIGGGGFATVYDAKTKDVRCLDFRERAPVLAHRNLFVRDGKARPDLSQIGALAAGVPGEIAGLFALHDKLGKRPMRELFDAAIAHAQNGFLVSSGLGESFAAHAGVLERFEPTKKTWQRGGRWPQTGDKLVQADLAKTLKLIRDKGKDAFYKGEIAQKIVQTAVAHGGILSMVDMNEYEVKWREPLSTVYRGYTIYSMPPPSSGGVHLIELLNVLENLDPASLGFHSPLLLHYIIEAMRRVYADRATYLGDPAFTAVPLQGLMSKAYAKKLFDGIDRNKASKSDQVGPGDVPGAASEPTHTTHLSVVDEAGNAVAMTLTVNGRFGSSLVAAGAGFVLNNEMDDFSISPGVPNLYGLVGNEANAVAPRKTPLSSMTPTIVLKDGQLRYALGAPGGGTIITTVFWALHYLIDFNADVEKAISLARIHEQWRPDQVMVENFALDVNTIKSLKAMGHTITFRNGWGNAQIVGVTPEGQRVAASDPREGGFAQGY